MKTQVLIPEAVIYTILFIFIIFASYNIVLYITHSFASSAQNENTIKYFYTLENIQDVLLKNATYISIKLGYPTNSKIHFPYSKIVINNGTLTIYTK